MPPDPEALGNPSPRLLVLGLNAWAVAVFVPLLFRPDAGRAAWGAATIAVLILAAGLVLLRRSPQAAPWLLLGAFPATALGGIALAPPPPAGAMGGALPLSLGALSLVAFLLDGARLCATPRHLRTTTPQPLGERDGPRVLPDGRRWKRRVLLTVAALGAFAIAVVAPRWGEPGALARDWGDATAEAEVLVAVTGGMLALALLALFVAPATRRRRRPRVFGTQVKVRIALLLILASMGAYLMHLLG